MPHFVVSNEYIPLSVYFIETYLKETSGIFLKVYLYGLNLAVKGVEADISVIASELDILESDVVQAFAYWKNKGLILEENGIVEFCTKPVNVDLISKEPTFEQAIEIKKTYDSIEIANSISKNQSLKELVLLAEELFAKPLNQQELETIYWFYDELNFSTEAILLILDYCISRDKKNMRYIEKVAISWHENGLRTAEKIMEYISEEEKKTGAVYRIQKGLGIADRPLSNAEEQYIIKWTQTYTMSDEMIMLAYEYCLLNTSKLSMPYMDKIIERWNKAGIFTKEAAEEDNKNHKVKNNGGFNAFEDSFNHNELEKFTRNRE